MSLEHLDDEKRVYLIRKRGGYYRPNAQGYTNDPRDAGRYTEREAWSHSHPNGADGPRDGMSYIHEVEVMPEPVPAPQLMWVQLGLAGEDVSIRKWSLKPFDGGTPFHIGETDDRFLDHIIDETRGLYEAETEGREWGCGAYYFASILSALCQHQHRVTELLEANNRYLEEARAARREAKALRDALCNPPGHEFWGAGEPDCPPDLKAGNGELHTLQCKHCGKGARTKICQAKVDALLEDGAHG